MRPRTFEEFVGQEHLVGPGALLRRAIEADDLPSAIFWGPPGCGKSTLAGLIAHYTRSEFVNFSAVLSGVGEVRKAMEAARERRRALSRRTTLFVDEIHRFNRAQQDAFLPTVEDGTIVLIGATTENPYFEVNTPLLSRARIFRFNPLTEADLRALVERALSDSERGLGGRFRLEPEALDHLLSHAAGDARRALNALEAATAGAGAAGEPVLLDLATVEDALQQRALVYDSGDQHYDCVSAFIKSMRGSDPDAAVYWLHRMLAAGEDPRFLCRRMVIHASEDVGMADPQALVVAVAAAHALELAGLPEAQIPMTQAAIHIATAPKSNSVVRAIGRVQEDLRKRQQGAVPRHLRDTSYPGAARLGHGKGYLYPHDFPTGFVPQQYLPEGALSGPAYVPTQLGHEQTIARRLAELQGAEPVGGGAEPEPSSEVRLPGDQGSPVHDQE